MTDNFGDRMKMYEMAEAGRKLHTNQPTIARLDGKCFSSFTSKLERPYDKRLSDLMISTTKYLAMETNACMGYTQSDEITLAWPILSENSEFLFNARIQKINSVLASMCTAYFNKNLPVAIPEKDGMALFDCRVWNVPNNEEGANAFLWREQDASKNSISMAARAYFSHKEILNKNGLEMKEMLLTKGIDWNNYPSFFKRGTFIQKRIINRKFTAEELTHLPEKHAAHKNPNLFVIRSDYFVIEMPPFVKVTNRANVVFAGAEPHEMERT